MIFNDGTRFLRGGDTAGESQKGWRRKSADSVDSEVLPVPTTRATRAISPASSGWSVARRQCVLGQGLWLLQEQRRKPRTEWPAHNPKVITQKDTIGLAHLSTLPVRASWVFLPFSLHLLHILKPLTSLPKTRVRGQCRQSLLPDTGSILYRRRREGGGCEN